MKNQCRSIIYRLNESNSNNPANLLVGNDVKIIHYENGEIVDTSNGVIEQITNECVIVKDNHTQKNYNFILNGFNAHEGAIEYDCSDNDMKFYVY